MLTIRAGDRELDCTYGGFMKLRETAAGIAGDGFYDLYFFPVRYFGKITDQKSATEVNKLFNEKIRSVRSRYGAEADGLIRFLTEPDAGGSLTENQCVSLFSVFDGATEKQLNTSISTYRPVLVRDFVELLADGAEEGGIEWY